MTILKKEILYEYIPGDPGIAGNSGSPYRPAYCVFEPGVTVYRASSVGAIQVWVETEDNPLTIGNESGGYFVWVTNPDQVDSDLDGSAYTLPGTTVCYDAVPAVPAVPYEPPTPTQVIAYYAEGWNSWASSIPSLDNNEIFYCTVSPNLVGAFIGVGKAGMEGRTTSSFSHGVLIDSNGAYVYEYGLLVAVLSSSFIDSKQLRISRNIDNSISYLVGKTVYTSQLTFSVFSGVPSYVYGYLYSGEDQLLTAGIEAGQIITQYGSASLEVTSSLTATDILVGATLTATSSFTVKTVFAGALLEAASSLTARLPAQVTLTATSFLLADSIIGIASNTTLGALNGIAGESSFITQPVTYLGALTTEASEGGIIPATPIRALGNLPSIVGTSALVNLYTNECDGDMKIPKPIVNASFGIYGDLDVPTPSVSGTFFIPTYLSGNLDLPLPEVAGTFNTTRLFTGDINVPSVEVAGVILTGNVFSGNINVPKVHVNATIPFTPDFTGDINIPKPRVQGIIVSTTDDSVWEYSEGVTCQQ